MPQPFLQLDERNKLIQIVAGLYDFIEGSRGRRVLLESAGLERFKQSINLSGAARTVAADVVSRLERFGILPERNTYHALGALLSYLLTLGDQDLPPEDAAFIARLIVTYALVADSQYLRDLQSHYNLGQPTHPQIGEGQGWTPAVSAATIPPQPEFGLVVEDVAQFQGLERVIDDESNFLDIYALFGAIYSAQAVCRIEIPKGDVKGTGFLVGPDLVLTNQHVLQDPHDLQTGVARFDYMLDASGVASPGRVFPFRPDLYHASPAEELDYAMVRLQDQPLRDKMIDARALETLSMFDLVRMGKHRGYLLLAPRFIEARSRVNIIQHPDGDPLKVVMTHNYVIENMSDSRVQYLADTMGGSSGSPVFNKLWEVVALHHSGQPYPPESMNATLKKIAKGQFRINEGIPVRALLKDFQQQGLDRYLPRT